MGEGLEAWALGQAGRDGAEARAPSTAPHFRALPGKYRTLLKEPGGRCPWAALPRTWSPGLQAACPGENPSGQWDQIVRAARLSKPGCGKMFLKFKSFPCHFYNFGCEPHYYLPYIY